MNHKLDEFNCLYLDYCFDNVDERFFFTDINEENIIGN